MYSVSEDYKNSMLQHFREQPSARVHVLNIDTAVQRRIGVTASGQQSGTDLTDILHISGRLPTRMAAETTHYISSAKSNTAAEGSGYRLVPSAGLTLTGLAGLDTVTLHLLPTATPTVLYATGTRPDGTSAAKVTYTLDAGAELVQIDCRGYSKLSLSSDFLRQPGERLHVLRIYAGACTTYTGADDLLDLGLDDVNDCVGLELPQRTLTVGIANRGQYTAEQEYDSPSWRQYSTQALAHFGATLADGAVEWVPLGRYFLDGYEVTDAAVNMRFGGALTVLNALIHYWSHGGSEYTNVGLRGELEAILETVVGNDVPDGPYKQSGALLYGIRTSPLYPAYLSGEVYAACPPMPAAQSMQLYCLLAGVMLYECRELYDVDIRQLDMSQIALYLPGDQYFGWPKWTPETPVGTIDMQVYRRDVGGGGTLATRLTVGLADCVPVLHDGGLILSDQSISCKQDDSAMVATAVYHYPYITYFDAAQPLPSCTVTGTWYNLGTQTVSCRMADTGDTIKVDCPLVTGRDDYPPEQVAAGIYRVLRNHMTATIEHRGHPEIDCGDVIAIDGDGGRRYIPALVVGNHWRMTGGALRGSIDIRRMDAATYPIYDAEVTLTSGGYYLTEVPEIDCDMPGQVPMGTQLRARFDTEINYQPDIWGCYLDVNHMGIVDLRWANYAEDYTTPLSAGLYLLYWAGNEWWISREIQGGLET